MAVHVVPSMPGSPNPGDLYMVAPTVMASDLPVVGTMIRHDEVAAGVVDHVLWGCTDNASSSRAIWPARRTDGPSTSDDAVPMGARLRLRDGVAERFTQISELSGRSTSLPRISGATSAPRSARRSVNASASRSSRRSAKSSPDSTGQGEP